MHFKLQKRRYNIECAIDSVEYRNHIVWVTGWMFSYKYSINNMKMLIKTADKEFYADISAGINRSDVYVATKAENAKKSGFRGQVLVENLSKFEVCLVFEIGGKICKYKIATYELEEEIDSKETPVVQSLNMKNIALDFKKVLLNKNFQWEFPEEFYENKVNVIVPVYNGFQYLEKLFKTIELTRMTYQLIILNDNSSDERVSPFLEQYAAGKENVILIENDNNLGFVKNVNQGLKLATENVVIVNTDVELPELWLERLIYPVLKYDDVASATPYTNCGTIVSFPKIGKDNELFNGMDLNEIDNEFKKIEPRYTDMPTGVGFCMAMSKKAILEVGLLDEEKFGMGYGEENDWCQRAILKGFRNVHVENLFVYHKHGGSFLSEDKKRYLEENSKVLAKKHPNYNKQVARYFTVDVNKDIRWLVKYKLIHKNKAEKTIVALDHSLGGGATSYLINKKNHYADTGNAFYIIRYNYVQNLYQVLFYFGKDKYEFYIKDQKEIFDVLSYIEPDEIWINELVTYPDLYVLLEELKEYSLNSMIPIKMLLHDYFAICPTINLLDSKKKYCNIPEERKCQECFERCNASFSMEFDSIKKWRVKWNDFLKTCETVIVFSNDSKDILQKAYPEVDNIEVIPHQIDYIPTIQKKTRMTDSFTIGLLGMLSEHKGRKIVENLIEEIDKRQLNIKIVLIGSAETKIESKIFKETGRYTRDSIPRLTLQNDIDLFLIPSIWPETFSYTAEEVMRMNMPVMCFDIGAPAERIAKYEKGYVIKDMTADAILDRIEEERLIQKALKHEKINHNILFVTGEESFASRYRVQHLREQLLLKGIASQCVMNDNAKKCKLDKFDSIVLYRVSDKKITEYLVKRAHKLRKKVYYDIDDYIFEYEKIKGLQFLQGEDYKDFAKYSTDIKYAMSLCDGYIVSTTTLKKAVEDSFPGKPVLINKNVFSIGMDMCSKKNWDYKKKDKIYLGYFSGTKTHNEDFESIKEQILKIMIENENVYLYIGGQISLPEEFSVVEKRIETFKFVDWRNLPRLIAKADINLMPLQTTFFHSCKSANKWMEAAMVSVPTVATWNEELERAIEHEVDGYLCKTVDDWAIYLQKLIDCSELRDRIAKAAYSKVMKNYSTYKVEEDVIKLLCNK